MSNVKLSQIAAGSPVNFNTDFLVGVQSSNTTDARITPAQLFTSFPIVNTSTNGVAPVSPGGTAQFLRADGTWATPSSSGSVMSIDFVIDGGGALLTVGTKGYLKIDFSATINEVSLLADQSGSVVIDIAKCTYAQFDAGTTHPAFPGDSITASAVPTISSSTKYDDTTLTGWTININAGDILAYQVKSAPTNVQRVTVALKVTR